jgi:ATP-dependent Clp protease adaptor protein ClpS
MSTITKKQEITEVAESVNVQKSLILFNDDVNTFDHVINCLISYCNHSPIQAEQCAYIVHYNGKCEIKRGTLEILLPIKEALLDNGLTVSIR